MHRPFAPLFSAIPRTIHVTTTLRMATVGLVALLAFGGLSVRAQEGVVAKVDGRVITEADMRLAEAEIGNDLGSLPDATRRRVLAEFLIENQLFADAAERQKLSPGTGLEERLQYWRRRTLRDVYFDKNVKDWVNDEETKRYYEQHVGALKPEEEVRARQGEFQGPGVERSGRRTRLLHPGTNGAAIRGGRIPAQGRRGWGTLRDPVRVAHHQSR